MNKPTVEFNIFSGWILWFQKKTLGQYMYNKCFQVKFPMKNKLLFVYSRQLLSSDWKLIEFSPVAYHLSLASWQTWKVPSAAQLLVVGPSSLELARSALDWTHLHQTVQKNVLQMLCMSAAFLPPYMGSKPFGVLSVASKLTPLTLFGFPEKVKVVIDGSQ